MTDGIELRPRPLTRDDFAPFGDVIAVAPDRRSPMNGARFDRYADLARVDIDGIGAGRAGIGIVRARSATRLPYCFDTVERHPLGSQAFVPLAPFRFIVVVAPPGDEVSAAELTAFVTNGQQGINYGRGVWHMPLIALEAGQQFLVIDRGGGDNYDEYVFDSPVRLLGD